MFWLLTLYSTFWKPPFDLPFTDMCFLGEMTMPPPLTKALWAGVQFWVFSSPLAVFTVPREKHVPIQPARSAWVPGWDIAGQD